MSELVGKRITLFYAPASEQDQATINAYGNIFSVPAYLLQLRPQLRIEGKIVAEGSPIGFGEEERFIISFLSEGDRVENYLTAGALYAIYLNGQVAKSETILDMTQRLNRLIKEIGENDLVDGCLNESLYGDFLYIQAQQYFVQLNLSEDLITDLMELKIMRGISEAMASVDVGVSYFFGVPRSVKRTGYLIDADKHSYTLISPTGNRAKTKEAAMIIGYTASALEHFIWEQKFGEGGVSAVKALQLASEQGIPLHNIDKTNINTILPTLKISQEIKTNIQNAVNQGKKVKVSEREISYKGWTGTGYIILDPETGEGAYMISGVSGGWQHHEKAKNPPSSPILSALIYAAYTPNNLGSTSGTGGMV